ncbi:flippase-like domain-containing protein [Phragmitibacter flavus]|uniref:Flippase-like domain-containing protein n=1 Tax=Phragmitibacter flavus TaxID=2576071 RepID=A0A5R8KAC0_9BACT|nr:lysylphosphatidylglycerol synthase transmembrane domain-containing protein [Phragmitibacter flavus]TLD68479.1 flippase-like domain-containing protein [Phragmitibacter flavus]
MPRRHWMLLLRLACGGALLWWALRRAEFASLPSLQNTTIHFGWLLLAMLFGGLAVLGWAMRWRAFVQMNGMALSFRESIRLTMFADFFNFYFLGPLGADGIRAVFLNRQFPNQKLRIAQSILLDHGVGLMAGTILYILFTRPQTAWLTSNNSMVPGIALVATDIILGIMGLLTLSAFTAICFPSIWNHINSKPFLRRITFPLRPFLHLQPHRNAIYRAQIVSILSILSGYAAYWCSSHAVAQPIPPLQMLAIMPMVDAIAAIPITISGLGVRENLFVELLGHTLPMGAQGAVTVSLLGFAVTGIWGLVGGIWLGLHRIRSGTQSASTSVTQQT